MSLKIVVEYTVDSENFNLDENIASKMKRDIEPLLPNKQLADYMWKLGSFVDLEVVNVRQEKSYDTKQ